MQQQETREKQEKAGIGIHRPDSLAGDDAALYPGGSAAPRQSEAFPPCSPTATEEYQSALDGLRFPLEVEFPEVILSYATKSADGCGEWWMWQVAGALRAAGISSYNGKQNVVGDDWCKVL